MSYFEKIKKYYRLGIYKKSHITKFMEKGLITESQYRVMIEGEEDNN